MANHITNLVSFSGPGAHEFLLSLLNRKSQFDFNKVIPIPKELSVTHNSLSMDLATILSGHLPSRFDYGGREIGSDLDIQNDLERIKKQTGASFEKYLKEARTYLKNIQNYGFPTWYEANQELWGTKWNAYDQTFPQVGYLPQPRSKRQKLPNGLIRVQEFDVGYAMRQRRKRVKAAEITKVEFHTAWRTPENIWNKLVEIIPEGVTAHVKFADEDFGSNCGEFKFIRGRVFDENIAPSWREMDEEMKAKWIKFAFHVRYGDDAKPTSYGMNDQYEYVEDDE